MALLLVQEEELNVSKEKFHVLIQYQSCSSLSFFPAYIYNPEVIYNCDFSSLNFSFLFLFSFFLAFLLTNFLLLLILPFPIFCFFSFSFLPPNFSHSSLHSIMPYLSLSLPTSVFLLFLFPFCLPSLLFILFLSPFMLLSWPPILRHIPPPLSLYYFFSLSAYPLY